MPDALGRDEALAPSECEPVAEIKGKVPFPERNNDVKFQRMIKAARSGCALFCA